MIGWLREFCFYRNLPERNPEPEYDPLFGKSDYLIAAIFVLIVTIVSAWFLL